jgi:hypothetical protein
MTRHLDRHDPPRETGRAPDVDPVYPRFNAVYHVTAINHWELILEEQGQVLFSNCNLKSLYVTVATASGGDLARVVSRVGATAAYRNDLPIRYFPCNLDQFEHPALMFIDSLASRDPASILYFHMKGVSYSPPRPRLEAWRRYLNTFVGSADRWAEVLAQASYDACGPLLLSDEQHGFTYFAGNFWMATAAYIRRLPAYSSFIRRPGSPCFAPYSRYLAEVGINRARQMRPYSTDRSALTPQSFRTLLESLSV